LVAAGGLVFDAMTPQVVSVTVIYVSMVLIGIWFSRSEASLGIALLATPLIIVGYWITIPDGSPVWVGMMNRGLAVAGVWLTAVFVWHIRVVEQKLGAAD
jgi:hypothetical protein